MPWLSRILPTIRTFVHCQQRIANHMWCLETFTNASLIGAICVMLLENFIFGWSSVIFPIWAKEQHILEYSEKAETI